jgi:hypothetical protein
LILGPKLQFLRQPGVQAAAGVFQVVAEGGSPGGLAYGVVTLGGPNTAFTAGYGVGYGQFWDSEGSPRLVFLGAEKSLGRSVRLMAEGFLGGDDLDLTGATLVGAVRLTRGRFYVDLGFVLPIYETGGGVPYPLFTAAWTF